MTRRKHKSINPELPQQESPTQTRFAPLPESDAGDRVRDWELPITPDLRRKGNLIASLIFLGIIGVMLALGWRLWLSIPETTPDKEQPGIFVPSSQPKEVFDLPGSRVNGNATDKETPASRPVEAKTITRLNAPELDGKWALAEFPTTGDRVEIDPSGIYAYAKNFTEACVRPPANLAFKAAARARESALSVRSFMTNGEACATIFDEPLIEIQFGAELRAVQFGLQQGLPFVAVKRIKQSSVPLIELAK